VQKGYRHTYRIFIMFHMFVFFAKPPRRAPAFSLRLFGGFGGQRRKRLLLCCCCRYQSNKPSIKHSLNENDTGTRGKHFQPQPQTDLRWFGERVQRRRAAAAVAELPAQPPPCYAAGRAVGCTGGVAAAGWSASKRAPWGQQPWGAAHGLQGAGGAFSQ
jgi:hypothetical protein